MARLCGIQKAGVLLDCYDCGRTCYDCKKDTLKTCRRCSSNFCASHDSNGSDNFQQPVSACDANVTVFQCDWCQR
ncbi:hypothetical protein DRE_03441 [Drechslerella stenobrocha 248]|uniref:Uncharacterized protein n=1 Tax=Drechslerella stenobrocha 248 TaxID=1043628 RepID=W7I3U5_9PEZI|nr:hypothetical protein DRE_03441 [Drechslerella stenobrocha 248]